MNKLLILAFIKDNFYKIFFVLALTISLLWVYSLFDNSDSLNSKIVAYELENIRLKNSNTLLASSRDSLNKSITSKDSIISNMVQKDKSIQILVTNIDKQINLLNKKYDQASNRVNRFNSDSIVGYFSKYY
jgi:peptidoglycan hydrolase CwlO-like protein